MGFDDVIPSGGVLTVERGLDVLICPRPSPAVSLEGEAGVGLSLPHTGLLLTLLGLAPSSVKTSLGVPTLGLRPDEGTVNGDCLVLSLLVISGVTSSIRELAEADGGLMGRFSMNRLPERGKLDGVFRGEAFGTCEF